MLFAEFVTRLSCEGQNRKAVAVFCRAMLVFALVKILFIWNASLTLVSYYKFATPRSFVGKIVFLPSVFANDHLSVVYIVFIIILVTLVILPRNYISGIVFFWLTLNLYRLNIPLMNGSDNVQLALAGCMVFMSMLPRTQRAILSDLQVTAFNTAVIMAQLIILCIYFISGWDKLVTESWRTGDVFLMISNRSYLSSPFFSDFFTNPVVNSILAWATILFELLFVVLVWFKRTRLLILITGILFHFIIAIMLNLPDFSMVMSIAYLVFLKDTDYIYLKNELLKK